MSKSAVALFLALALAACGGGTSGPRAVDTAAAARLPAPDGAIPAAEAEALFAGAVATGTTATGVEFIIAYAPDGSARLDWRYLRNSGSDTGTWRIASDGALCTIWSATDGGVEECEHVLPQADGGYRRIDAETGADRATFTLQAAV